MTDSRTISQTLAQFVQGAETNHLPARIVELAKIRRRRSVDCARRQGITCSRHGARRWWQQRASHRDWPTALLPAIDAAFANATLVNGRSQDDFMQKSHPGALTVPAVLAIADQCAENRLKVLAGIVAG